MTTKFLNQSKEKQPKSVPQKKQTSKDTSQEHIQKTNNNTPEKSPQIIQESFLGLSLQQLRSLIRETIQQELISASTVNVKDVGNQFANYIPPPLQHQPIFPPQVNVRI